MAIGIGGKCLLHENCSRKLDVELARPGQLMPVTSYLSDKSAFPEGAWSSAASNRWLKWRI